MKPTTFNQLFAAGMSVLFLLGLSLILFIPMHGNATFQSGIVIAFSSGMTGCIGYLLGNAHKEQDSDKSQLIDALANSTPAPKNT